MKVIIHGTKSYETDIPKAVERFNLFMDDYTSVNDVTEIVTSLTRGPSLLAKAYAEKHNIRIKEFPIDPDLHPKTAGVTVRKQMVEYADNLVIIWDMESPSSRDLMDRMEALDKDVYVADYTDSIPDGWT
jgi:hypothetical protein